MKTKLAAMFLGGIAYAQSEVTPELINEIISILTQIILLVWTLVTMLRRKKPIEDIETKFEEVSAKINQAKNRLRKKQ